MGIFNFNKKKDSEKPQKKEAKNLEVNAEEVTAENEKKKPKKTKVKIVKEHLLKSGYIDAQTAWEKYGITRLSAKIHQLRHVHKLNIETEEGCVKDNETGELIFCRYRLKVD